MFIKISEIRHCCSSDLIFFKFILQYRHLHTNLRIKLLIYFFKKMSVSIFVAVTLYPYNGWRRNDNLTMLFCISQICYLLPNVYFLFCNVQRYVDVSGQNTANHFLLSGAIVNNSIFFWSCGSNPGCFISRLHPYPSKFQVIIVIYFPLI